MTGSTKLPITLDVLDDYLAYNPTTGDLWWLRDTYRRSRARAGDLAGSPRGNGYEQIGLLGNVLHAHRVAWALAHRVWPVPHSIDHINGDRSDNRLSNLRAATQSENMRNTKLFSTSVTGLKGVHRLRNGRYAARITHNYKGIHLGCFATKEEAKRAYDEAAKHFHGDFRRL